MLRVLHWVITHAQALLLNKIRATRCGLTLKYSLLLFCDVDLPLINKLVVTASSIIWAREKITGAALTMASLGEVSEGFQRSPCIYKKLVLSLRESSSSSCVLRDRPNSIRIASDYVLPYTSSTAFVCLCRYMESLKNKQRKRCY